MIPLIPALALAILSFLCSAFVILRIVLPILPPHPLSRRVSPSEFGLPNYRSLTPSDKSHLWLAILDILALASFVWQTVSGAPTNVTTALDPMSTFRLWLAMTLRQSCLLIVVGLTLLHVRMAKPISFGAKHWMLWMPTTVLAGTSTGIAVVLSGAQVPSLFIGVMSYSTTIALSTTVAFCCLVKTLLAIKRNLAAIDEDAEPWPPVKMSEPAPRPSFATEEVDALRDGASWITSNASNASSRHDSVGGWSFSTHAPSTHGGRHGSMNHPSVPAKSGYWFNSSTPSDVPPVPQVPSEFGPLSPTAQELAEPDPFRRDAPLEGPHTPRPRYDSQTSWLTSTNGTHTVVSAWSYPSSIGHHSDSRNVSAINLNDELLPSHTAVSRPTTPAIGNVRVLGGYGLHADAEKSLAALAAAAPSAEVDISGYRAIGWLLLIWAPVVLSLPYLILSQQNPTPPAFVSILLSLSVTVSSPILALNLIFQSPMPAPEGLFDTSSDLPANMTRSPLAGSVPPYGKWSHEYKRSTSASVTVVEGRRSGDVWLAKGDAVDGRNKVGRAFGMISPMPKLSVLPLEENPQVRAPPTPIPDDDSSLPVSIHNSTQSEMSAQFGRLREHSSAVDESSGGQIMVAHRHFSTLAQTMMVSSGASPEKQETQGTSTAVRQSAHLRTRSTSSAQHGDRNTNISPPPSFPLPPTPPSVRAARLAHLKHRKSFSSGYSFGPVDDINEIDVISAGMLPLLVPGLKVGSNMKIRDTPPASFSRAKGKRAFQEFGGDISSPQLHSTPAGSQNVRSKKRSMHGRHHFSLPSLGLGKDGVHPLADEIAQALQNHDARRVTVFGGESVDHVQVRAGTQLTRALSSRRLGLQSDVPHSARQSLQSFKMPNSAASTATLFEEFDGEGPQAESTPHNNIANKPVSKQRPPPLPLPNRRSSIVYITSPVEDPATNPSAMSSIAQWSSRVIARPAKLQRKISDAVHKAKQKQQPGSPGLRPLALLQDRDVNSTPPLSLRKKNHGSSRMKGENVSPEYAASSAGSRRSLKPLQLSRKETRVDMR
ncbi:unnamed protein product [Mycena citricolor]|uniref:Uncharacterized protein n=1 Tax=Mycena citricolor TaxID=2018698 RepID=A0AAD2HEM7_9AGAR|nr:unnamed protein product [Mycena citricolor]